jgi:Fe-S-cluster-containing dehydrogenase component
VNTIKLDTEGCIGCQAWFDACFVNVSRWDDAGDKRVVA